jgi:eukaryotic-like serine/threonine-protein kinase
MINPSQVEAIFFAALGEKTPAERAVYLDRACGDDVALRRRVERLLAAHPLAVDFLGRPAVDRNGIAPHGTGHARAANSPPSQIGDYRILREIGRGGMGLVYEAEQVSLGRRVALKVLPGHVAGNREALERFRREAKSAARLHHTNIVPVFEVGRVGEAAYYAMQFIQGQGLDQVIDELARLSGTERPSGGAGSPGPTAAAPAPGIPEPTLGRIAESLLSGRFATEGAVPARDILPAAVPGLAATRPFTLDATHTPGFVLSDPEPAGAGPTAASGHSAGRPGGSPVSTALLSGRRTPFYRSAAQIGRQAARGLAYAHASGLVHRDIKPSNLLLDHAGVVWIADFGLAKGNDDGLTHTGDILGTIRYMAPERFRGVGDARADIYALGLTLYELLTLRPGFDSPDRLELIERIKTEEPRHPRAIDSRIPRDLETIVLKAIEKAPEARYQTAEAMGEDLGRFLADEPIRARPISTSERYWRWARHNPGIAVLGGVLTALLVAVTVGSLLAARRFATVAERAGLLAAAERSARLEADQAREAAQAESYHAVLSQVKALRAGHPIGWRDEALDSLARLAVMPTPRRDLVDLRTEAVATLGTLDIRLVTRIRLPGDDIRSIAFSPDGRTLISGGFTRGLDFWDMRGQRHLAAAHGLKLTDVYEKSLVAFLPDARGLAVATRDHGVVFTDTRGNRTARAPITLGSSRPKELAIDADGHWIAVAWTEPPGITVHDAVSGALVGRFEDSPFALSPDGRWLARTEQGVVLLQPLGSGGLGVELGRHDRIRSFSFSADSTMLASASMDHTTRLWNVAKRQHFGTLRGHRGVVTDVAFSPDGGAIATASGDYTARIWDTQTGRELATLPVSAWMGQVDWSSDGEYLAATTDSKQTVFLYRVTGRLHVQRRLIGHGSDILRVASHPRLERFATFQKELITWNVSDPQPAPRRLGDEAGMGTALAYSPDGSLLATGSWIWFGPRASRNVVRDADTGEVRSQFSTPQDTRALAFDPAGRRIASGDSDGNAVVWDLSTSRPVRQFDTGGPIWSIHFLDGGRRLVTHGRDSVLLYNLDAGEVERRAMLQGGVRRFAADSARDRLVVAFRSGAIGSVSLPDLAAGHRLENAHKGTVECLALSPDGRLLATGGVDHRVVLRDPLSFEPLLSFPDWNGNLREMAFDASSRRLAIVGTDPDVELWDLAALADGLNGVGLPWARPSTTAGSTAGAPGDRPSSIPEVVEIHPQDTDPAEFDEARLLMQSGFGANRSGRLADAIRDLRRACDRFRTLQRANPGDRHASPLGYCLGGLAQALRESGQPLEALASIEESRGVLEALIDPDPGDLYNLARGYSQLSLLGAHATPPATLSERAALADRALDALRRALVAGYSDFPAMDRDKSLDPLRGRADYGALTLDRGFPLDPFAGATVADAERLPQAPATTAPKPGGR